MQRNFNSLKNQSFDVLICGGGIYGAWTAYDAALRGLKVAIVDKHDWAGATSSASSKLIHGGLRYLETLDFKLVRKSLDERSMLLTTAPHRVWPLRFGIPIYESNRLGRIKLKIGLTLYDFLAGKLSRSIKHRYHFQKEFINRFPSLKSSKLKGGFTYADAQTDDARFVLELIDGACSAGAVCVNYCEVVKFEEKHGKLSGAVLLNKVDDSVVTIEASQVVDAMGRYSPLVQPDRNICRLTKGIHLIMPNILMDEALLLTAKSDGRVFFAIPWYGLTLLGTTDTNYVGDNDNVRIHNEDIHYLLSEANLVFDVSWTERDIIGKFAGIRVLQQSQQDNPTKITRDWDLRISENGLLSSIGGKFTSAREDAAIIVDKLCANLGVQAKCQTFGKTFPWLSNIDYPSLVTTSLSKTEHLGIDTESALWIVKRHGQRSASVFQLCEENPALASRIRTELPFILADLVFCACHENVIHLDDLLRRRMPLLILAKILPEELSHLAEITAKALAWDSEKTEAEITRCLQIQAAFEEY